MKHKSILDALESCLRAVPNLRVERNRRQPEDEADLRDFGSLAILYDGERESVAMEGGARVWARAWELKPIVTVLVRSMSANEQSGEIARIEDAFVQAMYDSVELQPGALLAHSSVPEFKTVIRHPDEFDIAGAEFFLNLAYIR